MKERVMYPRMLAVTRALGISNRKFCLSIGKSEGWVTSLRSTKYDAIPSDTIRKILQTYPMINRDFILEGKGEPILDETDTLSTLPQSYQPEADNYKELCMAYRQDLADTRQELARLREAYFQLLDKNSMLMASLAALQASQIAEETEDESRDEEETKKAKSS